MHSVISQALLAFVMPIHARELVQNHVQHDQDSADAFTASKSVDHLVRHLFARVSNAWSAHHADLDNATIGKPHRLPALTPSNVCPITIRPEQPTRPLLVSGSNAVMTNSAREALHHRCIPGVLGAGWRARAGGDSEPIAVAQEIDLIGRYRNKGFEALADGVMAFYNKRTELQRPGIAFGAQSDQPAKVSTDVSMVAIGGKKDPEAFALAEVIMRGVSAALDKYLQERPMFRTCLPNQSLFVNPIFNLQHYAPGEGFKQWHCDWTISDEATEPVHRVLAWILYCNDVPEGGTEFHWQNHHEAAERGKLVIFPAGPSHVHRGRVSHEHSKTIATGWINAGRREDYFKRLAEG